MTSSEKLEPILVNQEDTSKTVNEIIDNYRHHQSVVCITNQINSRLNNFDFKTVTEQDVHKVLKSLSCKKAAGYDEIPISFLKKTKRELLIPVTHIVNECIRQNVFPKNMTKANITPLYKKKGQI